MRCAGAKRRIFFWFYLSWDAVFLLSLACSANQNNNFECYTLPIAIFDFWFHVFNFSFGLTVSIPVWIYLFNSGSYRFISRFGFTVSFPHLDLRFQFPVWIYLGYRFNSEFGFTISIPDLDLFTISIRIWIYRFNFEFDFTVSFPDLDLPFQPQTRNWNGNQGKFKSGIETVNPNPELKR